jgi:hypothetical protein
MRGRILIATAAAALLAVGAAGADSFTDPVGDTPGPDIKSVDVTSSLQSGLVVNVALANRPDLEDNEVVEIDVDLDGNASTGDDSGIDLYGVLVGGDTPEVDIWQNGDFVATDSGQISFADGVAKLVVPLSLVGSTVHVAAQALGAETPPDSGNPPADPGTDLAPDTGFYTFTVAKPELRSATPTFSPARPRAGRTFSLRGVSVVLSTGGPFAAKSACSATLGGKKLGNITACAWRIPKKSKGKKLRVSIAASYETLKFNLARTFTVR